MSTQRELKFRVWDGHQIHYPKEGQYLAFFSAPNQVAWRLYERNGEGYVCDSQYGGKVMQYTGLRDQNGREIYERDIVDGYDGLRFEVQWCEYDGEWNIGGHDAERMDVIGNCFENPELIPA